jgi:hypothetical protein
MDIRAIVTALHKQKISYVLTGSVAAVAYGVPVRPRDFDIAPALTSDNMQRLADLLDAWSAKPVHTPTWSGSLSQLECEQWRPFPATEKNLDHLLTTPYGLFDVVPSISGHYANLRQRALCVYAFGGDVWIAHPSDLLSFE